MISCFCLLGPGFIPLNYSFHYPNQFKSVFLSSLSKISTFYQSVSCIWNILQVDQVSYYCFTLSQFFIYFLCFSWIFSAIYTIIYDPHGLIVFLFLPVEIHGEIHWWIRVMMKRFDYTCMCPCCLQQNRKKGSHHLLLNSSSTYFQIFLSWLFQFQCSMFFNDSIGISHDEFQDLICLSICTGSVLGFS